jgi:hypothetical protein
VMMVRPKFFNAAGQFSMPTDPVPWAGVLLVALAALMLVEAVRAIAGGASPPSRSKPAMAG